MDFRLESGDAVCGDVGQIGYDQVYWFRHCVQEVAYSQCDPLANTATGVVDFPSIFADVRSLEVFLEGQDDLVSDALVPPPIGFTGVLELTGVGGNRLEASIRSVPAPEPSLLALVALGMLVLGARRWRA